MGSALFPHHDLSTNLSCTAGIQCPQYLTLAGNSNGKNDKRQSTCGHARGSFPVPHFAGGLPFSSWILSPHPCGIFGQIKELTKRLLKKKPTSEVKKKLNKGYYNVISASSIDLPSSSSSSLIHRG